MSHEPTPKHALETRPASALVLDDDDSLRLVDRLTRSGFQAREAERSWSVNALQENSRPDLLLMACKLGDEASLRAFRQLVNPAREFGIPLVVVIDRLDGIEDGLAVVSAADDWLFADQLERELVPRLTSALNRHGDRKLRAEKAKSPAADSQFFRLVAHDLRSPLNVIGLSLRLIGQVMPAGDPEVAEDFRFIEENVGQIERIVTQIGDYFRLFEDHVALVPAEFAPRKLIEELIATRPDKPSTRFGKIELIAREECPDVVELDPIRAKLAISYVLANATAAAGSTPIQLILSRNHDQFRLEATLKTSPPASVSSTALSSLDFTRLCGVAAERRGMDLAIAAKVSEMFGGWARLEVVERVQTTIVLEWPLRFART